MLLIGVRRTLKRQRPPNIRAILCRWMNDATGSSKSETIGLTARIDTILVRKDEGSFTVASATVLSTTDVTHSVGKQIRVVAVDGLLAAAKEGEDLEVWGYSRNSPTFGEQFHLKSRRLFGSTPSSAAVAQYITAVIKGVGPVLARRIVDRFGDRVYETLEGDPKELLKVQGIGKETLSRFVSQWKELAPSREIVMLMQSLGLSNTIIQNILAEYGDRAPGLILANPYRLIQDFDGVTFQTVDRLAAELEAEWSPELRVQAAITYALREGLLDSGDTRMPEGEVVAKCKVLLGVEMAEMVEEGLIVSSPSLKENSGEGITLLATAHIANMEKGIATALLKLDKLYKSQVLSAEGASVEQELRLLTSQNGLTEDQKHAVTASLTNGVSIITGGPGVGKTFTVKTIVEIWRRLGKRVVLICPTARAAKKLEQVVNSGKDYQQNGSSGEYIYASTIHRALGFGRVYSNSLGGWKMLDGDAIVVDEMSMVDLYLASALVKAIQAGSQVVFVGDVDQLPSIGPGAVLRDLIASQVFSTTRLQQILRQAENSQIVMNAHLINQCKAPEHYTRLEVVEGPEGFIVQPKLLPNPFNPEELSSTENGNVFLLEAHDPEEAERLLFGEPRAGSDEQRGLLGFIQKLGYDPAVDVQVLSPLTKGHMGTASLNSLLQRILNPNFKEKAAVMMGDSFYCLGDRVMQKVNNYDRGTYNGDIGTIVAVDKRRRPTLRVHFEEGTGGRWKEAQYTLPQMPELGLAYALTIHKSQGCEFPVVVIPLFMNHFFMLDRSLLYTGFTRAREQLILVGSKKAVYAALGKKANRVRLTGLAYELQNAASLSQDRLGSSDANSIN